MSPAPGRAWPLAVALKYDPAEAEAPTVTARGRGANAERILSLAFEHGVKVREDPALAQILATVELDTQIPVDAFAAVAEVLAHVYEAENRLRAVAAPEPEEGNP